MVEGRCAPAAGAAPPCSLSFARAGGDTRPCGDTTPGGSSMGDSRPCGETTVSGSKRTDRARAISGRPGCCAEGGQAEQGSPQGRGGEAQARRHQALASAPARGWKAGGGGGGMCRRAPHRGCLQGCARRPAAGLSPASSAILCRSLARRGRRRRRPCARASGSAAALRPPTTFASTPRCTQTTDRGRLRRAAIGAPTKWGRVCRTVRRHGVRC